MDIDTSPLKRCSSAPVLPNATARVGSSIGPGNTSGNGSSPNEGPGIRNSSLRTQRSEDPTMPIQISPAGIVSDTPAAPNIFSRTRRYSSGSFSPLATVAGGVPNASQAQQPLHHLPNHLPSHSPSPAAASGGPRLTPRVSQLRKEECADISNTREVSHERGLHNQLQISQSWEDLTIVTENWSCRDDFTSTSLLNCSSPSPTSSRHHHQLGQLPPATSYGGGIRYPFGMSPSPTRKTFTTRRSMSPNHVRPSQLCPVKRKFDMDDSCGGSPPPHKKMFLDVVARGSSPIHSLPMCASPDSGTYEGRTTPKLFISKLCSSNSLSSFSSASASPTSQLDGMGEGVAGGDKGIASSNTNSNSSSSVTAAADSGTVGDAKEQDEDASKGLQQQELLDHPMADVSSEAAAAAAAQPCDKKREADVASEKSSPKESEVDDGIGEEVTGPADGGAKESESVPVI